MEAEDEGDEEEEEEALFSAKVMMAVFVSFVDAVPFHSSNIISAAAFESMAHFTTLSQLNSTLLR